MSPQPDIIIIRIISWKGMQQVIYDRESNNNIETYVIIKYINILLRSLHYIYIRTDDEPTRIIKKSY